MEKNNVYICKDCSKDFALTEGEIKFYSTSLTDDGRPMSLPKRCPLCRRKKKDAKRLLTGGFYHPLGGEYQRGLSE